MNRLYLNCLLWLFLMGLLVSCAERQEKYTIGISQCSEDIWREKQNSELRMDAYLHENVELRFAAAHDNDQRQIQQIDSLVATGIDLLIVAPNQISTITPAIDRAYDQGIPVIVFERKTNSPKYTAFMSADNYEMGRVMGEYIVNRLKGKGRVMDITGLKGSSPAIERHKGFEDVLKGYPDMTLVASLQGDWTEDSGYQAVMNYQLELGNIDFVFAQNDRMAMGARRAFIEKLTPKASDHDVNGYDLKLPLFCGIDGLPGENGGIKLVNDSILDATFIYPTHGDQLLDLALDILDGKPYEKETKLMAALVTQENANVLLLQSDEIFRQSKYVDELHTMSDNYLQQLGTQRTVNIMGIILVVLLMMVAVITYRYHLQRLRMQEERGKMEREQLDFYTQVSHELRTPLTLIEGPLEQLAQTKKGHETSDETIAAFAILRRNTHQLAEIINKMLDMQAKGRIDNLSTTEQTFAPIEEVPKVETDTQKDASDMATVLIVDDNADIRAYLRSILQDKYQVNEAVNGEQGLMLANEIVPDLIVSDVMMPVMNGLEFCQRVKSSIATSHIPVILLTARALSKHQIEGYESGADAYITKPFSAELLLVRISNLLKSRHLLKNLFATVPAPQISSDSATTESAQSSAVEMSSEEPPTLNAQLKEDSFLIKFRDFIENNMADSDLNVETIGAELGLSRVQLYRKVKALTGQSPVELLRKARLQKGQQLLQTTDKNVSEVAYEVGFTAPSYFTKCFKDEFGISPSDL